MTSNMTTFTWKTTGVAKGNYTIIAHATPIPGGGIHVYATPIPIETNNEGETDVEDNTMVDGIIKVTIPGDCDGDYNVDSTDLFTLAPAYGSGKGDPLCNLDADFDNDGDVDSMDLFTLAANYGKIGIVPDDVDR